MHAFVSLSHCETVQTECCRLTQQTPGYMTCISGSANMTALQPGLAYLSLRLDAQKLAQQGPLQYPPSTVW